MISGMRVKNIRSLRDSGQVDVKKINVLVGMNSSGKSTFLRTLPLLRQSVEVRTKGPILWYGRLVDFGDFREAKSTNSGDEPMSLSFDLQMRRASPVRPGKMVMSDIKTYRLPASIRAAIDIDQKEKDDVGFISKLTLNIASDVVQIHFESVWAKKIVINGAVFEPAAGSIWFAGGEAKLPSLTYFVEKSQKEGETYLVEGEDWLLARIGSLLTSIAHGNTSKDRLKLVAKQLVYAPEFEFRRQFASLSTAPDGVRYALITHANAEKSGYLDNLRALTLLRVLPAVLKDVSAAFEQFGAGVRYIEPVRASVERYYRLQDLAVDEIDSSGANTAMYLRSLDSSELRSLTSWMDDNLGFRAYPERSAGNVAVKIKIKGDTVGRNVTDLGFGYSQVLPVVLQLWHSCIKNSRGAKRASAIAIEQPELHLHPRFQSRLADVFVNVSRSISENSSTIPFFIETHSEHIINRLGALVADGSLNREDVQILLFDCGDSGTKITPVTFDEDGVLSESWPLGFFLPEV
ncbi:hypothetical protein LMG19146_03522 [Xanthomonas arboricola pv. fragariae]|uniref:AAA family ATPase n=1 Tax=Xanthomonas arboricola TaxID=56448 RepID=UPI000C8577D9|nr:AAA family ATPase [Xanthomonas arboricola]SOU04323.1 hypothetical protein LMG19146_03522 [Xanthomonas arboricola pv. fragariae]